MDDTGRLRRTVRRCTAIIVASIGVAAWAIGDPGSAHYGLLLVVPALLYLVGSLVYVPTADTESDASAD